MRFIAALPLLALVAAQSSNTVIEVGSTASAPNGGAFQFNPPSVNTINGIIITFRFTTPGNHSVTQSTFANPCNPVPGGFDSGNVFIPPNGVSKAPEWNLTVSDTTKPIWFFCKQLIPLVHCSAGMVGAINAPPSGPNTFEAFQSKAKQFQGLSGQDEGGLVGTGVSASAFPAPITDGASLYTNGAPIFTAVASSPTPTTSVLVNSTANSPSGSSVNPTNTGSGNLTSVGSVMSVNTFLVLSAAALGIMLV